MIVDLHSHYPMHLLADQPATLDLVLSTKHKSLGDTIRTLVLRLANRVSNYPGSGGAPAVTLASLKDSNVRVALSMVYAPFDEMDLGEKYGAPPRPKYFADLIQQIEMVEGSIAGHEADVTVAHNPAELRAALAANKIALIHAVEGGFHLGDTDTTVQMNVRDLAGRGIAYITVAHLFWRRVATNAPALPFLSDSLYSTIFRQPPLGLSDLGRAAMRAMVSSNILIDVTHMSEQAIDDTLTLLTEIDPQRGVPLIATHAACRFGRLTYNLADKHIEAIASRQGVIGLIACKHYMADTFGEPTKVSHTIDIICHHIDHIRTVTGSHEFTAFGSDQDGFIKPTLPGLERPAGYREVEAELVLRYGAQVAGQICSGNARRVLEYWGRGG